MKKTIVTLTDSNYFPLLEELIHSIRKFKESQKQILILKKENVGVEDPAKTQKLIQKLILILIQNTHHNKN